MACIANAAQAVGTQVIVALEVAEGVLNSPADGQILEYRSGSLPLPVGDQQVAPTMSTTGDGLPSAMVYGQQTAAVSYELDWKPGEQEAVWQCAFGCDDNSVGPTVFTADTVAATNTITAASGLDAFEVGSLVLVNGLVVASDQNYKFARVVSASPTALELDPEYLLLADETALSLTIWQPPYFAPGICGKPLTAITEGFNLSTLALGLRLASFSLTGNAEGTDPFTVSTSGNALDHTSTQVGTRYRYATGTLTDPVSEWPFSMQATTTGTAGASPGLELLILGGSAQVLGLAGLPLRSLEISTDLPKVAIVGTSADRRTLAQVEAPKMGGWQIALGTHTTPLVQPTLTTFEAGEFTDFAVVGANGVSKFAFFAPVAAITAGSIGLDGDAHANTIAMLATPTPGNFGPRMYYAADLFTVI